jgi:hypothetical protein
MTALQANDYNWTVSAKTASYVLVAADAGTRITMSNAGATTITVNTALFTAGDTLTITNIGAGACTITAGTATVSTAGSLVLNQYDSGTLYFSSTSAAIWNGANPGDITGVTAGTGISGGGTSGTVTITNSMATEITAAGDIIVGTGSGTFDNLPIGTTNQVLTADTTVSPYKVKWATPASGGSTFVGASAWMNSTVAIANATNTFVALADESFDTNSIHSNVTNNSRMTIPTGYAGKWLINGSILWQAGSGQRSIGLYKNGGYYGLWDMTPNSSGTQTQTMSVVLSLAVGDYIEMMVYQGSGGNLNLYGNSAGNGTVTVLSVSYLGA